jgi:hypothetical protein
VRTPAYAGPQIFTVLSSLPEASRRPSGEKATLRTLIAVPAEGVEQATGGHLPDLHRLVTLPEASRRPSGEKATLFTELAMPAEGVEQAGGGYVNNGNSRSADVGFQAAIQSKATYLNEWL